MEYNFSDSESLNSWLQGLSVVQWKTLISRRLRGLDDKLPPPEIRIDEKYEDIFIRLIPQLTNPENVFNAIITLYEEAITEFDRDDCFDNIRVVQWFSGIIAIVRFVLVRNYTNKFNHEKTLKCKNKLAAQACKLTKQFQKKLQYKEDKISKQLLRKVLFLLDDSITMNKKFNIGTANFFYSSLKGVA